MGKDRFQSMPNSSSANLASRSGVSLSGEVQNGLDKSENFAIGNSGLEAFLSSLPDSWIDKFSNQVLNLGDNLYSYRSSLDQDGKMAEGGLWWIHEGGVRLLVYDDARSCEVSIIHLTTGRPFVPIRNLMQSSSIGDSVQIHSAFSSYRVVASRDTILAYLDPDSLQL